MADYTIRHKEHDGTVLETILPENCSFRLQKKGVHTCNWEITHTPSTTHDPVGAYRTDFDLRFGSTVIMAGMITNGPTVSKESGFFQVSGKDWKHYLERRHYPYPCNSRAELDAFIEAGAPEGYYWERIGADVTVIIKKLLDDTLARPYSLAMTYPTLSTGIGIPTDFALAMGDTQYLLPLIEGFSDIDPGFDYDVLPTKEFRIYSPHKYDPDVFDTPSLAIYQFDDDATNEVIIEGPHFVNDGPFATHWLATGAGKTAAKMGVALGATASQLVYRRLDGFADYGSDMTRTQIQQRGMRDFSWALNPQHEIEMKVLADRITNFWTLFSAGQAIWLDDELISHQIQSAQEIVSMDCTINDQGECEVTLGLNQIYEGSAGTEQY